MDRSFRKSKVPGSVITDEGSKPEILSQINVLPLKCGAGQHRAIHATLTARDFFLISTLPVPGSCVGPQNKIGHPAGLRFPC